MTVAPTATPAASPFVSGTVRILVPATSPSHARRPSFVSPSAKSFSIVIDGAAPFAVNVSSCPLSSGAYVCSVPVSAAIGQVSATVSVYDAANGTGKLLGSGSASGTVTQGSPFSLPVNISPVAAGFAATYAYAFGSAFVTGTAGSATATVQFTDPDGNAIPAGTSFASTITLGASDPSITVSPTSLTAPATTLAISYNGSPSVAAQVNFTIATASGTVTASTLAILPAPTLSTFAGSGSGALTNGAALSAAFNGPTGIVFDASGNLYVADYNNNVIREIAAGGTVSTFAGNGTPGLINGAGSSAEFAAPNAIAIDTSGNLYVGDTGNYAIRKITPGAVVSTYAGNGYGFNNGAAAMAQFTYPKGVAFDATTGNVYVADTLNDRIRAISSAGIVSTLAGQATPGWLDATGAAAQFNVPFGIATDAAGNVYVCDQANNRIRKVTPSGVVTTIAGNGTQGYIDSTSALSAEFDQPQSLAVDANGNVFVSDTGNNVIREISNGAVKTIAGNGTGAFGNGPALSGSLNTPVGLAFGPNGTLYIADFYNNRIRIYTP